MQNGPRTRPTGKNYPVLWVGMYGKVKIQNFTNYYYNRFLTREQVKFQDEYNFFAYREV